MAKSKEKVIHSIDLKEDRKLCRRLLALSVLAAAVLVLIGCCFENIGCLFGNGGFGGLFVRLAVIAGGFILCLALNEVLRRLLIKKLSGGTESLGKKALFAPAGKMSLKNYAVISFVPVLALAVILTVLMLALPHRLLWTVYIIQTLNLSGAVGDIYVLLLAKKKKGKFIEEKSSGSFEIIK